MLNQASEMAVRGRKLGTTEGLKVDAHGSNLTPVADAQGVKFDSRGAKFDILVVTAYWTSISVVVLFTDKRLALRMP